MSRFITLQLVLYALFLPISHAAVNILLVPIGITIIWLYVNSGFSFWQIIQIPILKALAFFYLALFITVPFSGDPTESLRIIGSYITYVLPLLLLCLLTLPGSGVKVNTKMIVCSALLGIIISSTYGIYQYLITRKLFITGLTHHHAVFGSMLEIMIPLALSLFLMEKSKRIRVAALITVLLGTVALIFTQARGPWIGALAGISAVFYFSNQVKLISRKHLVLAFILIGFVLFAASPFYVDRIKTITNPAWVTNSERILIWYSTLQMIADYPIAGVGLGLFDDVYNTRYISPLSVEGRHPHAHNSYLWIFAEAGVIGFSANLLLLITTFKVINIAIRKHGSALAVGVMAAFIAILVNSFVDSFIWLPRSSKMLWFVIGLVLYSSSECIER